MNIRVVGLPSGAIRCQVLCEHCGERISPGTSGLLLWHDADVADLSVGAGVAIHKACHAAYVAPFPPEAWLVHTQLDYLPAFLATELEPVDEAPSDVPRERLRTRLRHEEGLA